MELGPTAYVVLGMLRREPRSGYEIKQAVDRSTRFFWAASYGQIYPELAKLAEAGLVEGDEQPTGGRKRTVYRLTDAGRAELEHRRQEVEELQARLARSVGELAKEIRDDVRESVRDLRQEIRHAVKDVRREERRVAKEAKIVASDTRRAVRSLQSDLQAFVSDVSAAARHHRLDASRLSDLREALNEARTIIVDALEGRRPYSGSSANYKGSGGEPPS